MRARFLQAVARLSALLRRRQLDADLDEDLATHIELLTDEYVARGLDQEAARRQARLRFGSVVTAVEAHRDVRSLRWIELAGSEVRWAWRAVLARGRQAALVVLLLGVALGASTTIFSAADAFVFNRTPYTQSDRLVVLEYSSNFGTSTSFSAPAIFEWRRQSDVLAAVEAHELAAPVYVTSGNVTELVRVERVSPGLFEMLGVRPQWGRPLLPSDAEEGAPPVALIGAEVASRAFSAPERAIGQTLATAQGPIAIVGVMPESFRFPSAHERIWRPLVLDGKTRNVGYGTIARLAPGIELEDAGNRIAGRAQAIDRATGGFRKRYPISLRTLADARGNERHTALFAMLAAAAAGLLLIACANVASLELAVGLRRARALGVQAALGAGRATLVRTRVFESAILLLASGGLGTLIAWWGMPAVTNALPPAIAQGLTNGIDLDRRALAFMIVAASFSWVVTALPAAWRASRASLMDVLRDVTPVARPTRLTRQALVVGQITATVLLLTVALLYARTYAARLGLDKGLDASNVATFQVLPAHDAAIKGAPLAERVRSVLKQHPAVRSAALTEQLPPSTAGWIGGKLQINGGPPVAEATLSNFGVSPEYFATLGIPFVAGENFAAGDSPARVVLDEALARRFWPEGQAVGSRFNIGKAGISGPTGMVSQFEVVGVVRAVRADRTVVESGREIFAFYYPMLPSQGSVSFVARLADSGALADVSGAIRASVSRTVVRADLLEDRYARLEGDRKVAATASGVIGLMALGIAAMGIYAVMVFIVSGRTREIGLRLALGAGPGDIRRDVIMASAQFAVIGTVLGLLTAVAASRWIESQLYEVSATDPITYATVALTILTVACLATWYPARQAARVDPAIALRNP